MIEYILWCEVLNPLKMRNFEGLLEIPEILVIICFLVELERVSC